MDDDVMGSGDGGGVSLPIRIHQFFIRPHRIGCGDSGVHKTESRDDDSAPPQCLDSRVRGEGREDE